MAFDMSQYVIVADPSECIRLAREASAVEGAAMQHDVEGRRGPAVKAYRRAAERLGEAAQACPEGHPDVKLLEQHIQEMLGRANYLEGLSDKPTSVIPLEEHIQDVQLTLGSPDFLDEGVTSPGSQYMKEAGGERKVMGAAAAVGGAAGLLLLGPLGGAALGVATAFATTREDQAGEAARKVGDVGVRLLDSAMAELIGENPEDVLEGMMAAGAAQTLAHLLDCGSADGRAAAAWAIGNLAAGSDPTVSEELLVAEPLLELLARGTADGRTNAALALNNLGVDTEP